MSDTSQPASAKDQRTEAQPAEPLPVPKVDAVGVLTYADWDSLGPADPHWPTEESMEDGTAESSHSASSPVLRSAVWTLLFFFALATMGTAILSAGAYCLTSQGADTRALHEAIQP